MSSWTDVEDAVAAWVLAASGLTSRHVVWDYWKAPRPAAPFVEMSITEDAGVGESWLIRASPSDLLTGTKVSPLVRSHREVQLTLQVFGDTDAGNTAWPIMSRVAASVDAYVEQLDLAGVGVGDVGPVQLVSGRKGGVLEPRARCQIGLHVGSELELRLDFFRVVELTITADAPPEISTTLEIALP